MATVAMLLLFFAAHPAQAACFEEAGRRYRISPDLLCAISYVESQRNPLAVNRKLNADGSYDIGHMQINSSWLPRLRKYGITEAALYDACVNTHVGAWVLADEIRQHGHSWKAVGAYNAKSPEKRIAYAHRVARALATKRDCS